MNSLFAHIALLLAASLTALASLHPITIEVKNEVASPQPSVIVDVDGKRAGISDAAGKVQVNLAAGEHSVMAYVPGFQFGRTNFQVPLAPNFSGVEVLVNRPDIEMHISSVRHGMILPQNSNSFRIELLDRKKRPLFVEEVIGFNLLDVSRAENTDIRDFFALDRGKIFALPEAMKGLRVILEKPRDHIRLNLRARVRNFDKRVIDIEKEMLVGRYTLSLKFLAGKSQGSFSKKNMHFRVRPVRWEPGLDCEFYVSTDTNGQVLLKDMPFAHLEVRADGKAQDPNFLWSWWLESYGNLKAELEPESLEGIRRGELPVRYVEKQRDGRFIVQDRFLSLK